MEKLINDKHSSLVEKYVIFICKRFYDIGFRPAPAPPSKARRPVRPAPPVPTSATLPRSSSALPAPLTRQGSLRAPLTAQNDLANNPLFKKCSNKNQF
jgi:hypothetical protein